MTPESAGYAEMTKYFVDVNEMTAKDRGPTFHAYGRPERSSHIDYCFVGEGVKPISQSVIDGMVDGKYPSDHYGLNIKIDIE